MINSSAAFAGEIAKSSRHFRARLFYNNTEISGTVRKVTVRLGSCGESSFKIGAVYSSQIEVTLDTTSADLQGKELRLDIGVQLPDESYDDITLGYFTCGQSETSKYQTKFTAQGRIGAVFNALRFTPPSTPTLANVASALTTQTGVTVSFASGITTSDAITKSLSGLTCREVLEVLASLIGGFATETASGNVLISPYSDTSTKTVAGDIMRFLPTMQDADMEITGVKVIVAEATSETQEVSYTSGTVNVSTNNAYMTSDLFTQYASNLIGLEYRPATVKLALGDPRLEPTDVLNVALTGETPITVPCMAIEHIFDGGWQTNVIAPGREEESTILGETGRKVREINSITEDMNERMSSMGGMYETRVQESGGGYTYYLHNKRNLNQSDVQLKITDQAVGVTPDGGQTWYGLTVDGTFIANLLSVNGIDANWINAGTLSGNYIHGGTITSGALVTDKYTRTSGQFKYEYSYTVDKNGITCNVQGYYNDEPSPVNSWSTTLAGASYNNTWHMDGNLNVAEWVYVGGAIYVSNSAGTSGRINLLSDSGYTTLFYSDSDTTNYIDSTYNSQSQYGRLQWSRNKDINLDNMVDKTGDSMTGTLKVTASNNLILRSNNITTGRATNLDSNAYGEEIWIRDSNDTGFAIYRSYEHTDGSVNVQMYVRNRANTSSTTWSNNSLTLGMKKDGTAKVAVTAPATWRSALGVPSTDVATTSANGLMSASDKTKLNNCGVGSFKTVNKSIPIGNISGNGYVDSSATDVAESGWTFLGVIGHTNSARGFYLSKIEANTTNNTVAVTARSVTSTAISSATTTVRCLYYKAPATS